MIHEITIKREQVATLIVFANCEEECVEIARRRRETAKFCENIFDQILIEPMHKNIAIDLITGIIQANTGSEYVHVIEKDKAGYEIITPSYVEILQYQTAANLINVKLNGSQAEVSRIYKTWVESWT